MEMRISLIVSSLLLVSLHAISVLGVRFKYADAHEVPLTPERDDYTIDKSNRSKTIIRGYRLGLTGRVIKQNLMLVNLPTSFQKSINIIHCAIRKERFLRGTGQPPLGTYGMLLALFRYHVDVKAPPGLPAPTPPHALLQVMTDALREDEAEVLRHLMKTNHPQYDLISSTERESLKPPQDYHTLQERIATIRGIANRMEYQSLEVERQYWFIFLEGRIGGTIQTLAYDMGMMIVGISIHKHWNRNDHVQFFLEKLEPGEEQPASWADARQRGLIPDREDVQEEARWQQGRAGGRATESGSRVALEPVKVEPVEEERGAEGKERGSISKEVLLPVKANPAEEAREAEGKERGSAFKNRLPDMNKEWDGSEWEEDDDDDDDDGDDDDGRAKKTQRVERRRST